MTVASDTRQYKVLVLCWVELAGRPKPPRQRAGIWCCLPSRWNIIPCLSHQAGERGRRIAEDPPLTIPKLTLSN